MTMVDDYTSLATHHCETGSMLEVYRHAGSTLSEEMLLGLGDDQNDADRWARTGEWFREQADRANPAARMGEAGEMLAECRDLEGDAWTRLSSVVLDADSWKR